MNWNKLHSCSNSAEGENCGLWCWSVIVGTVCYLHSRIIIIFKILS